VFVAAGGLDPSGCEEQPHFLRLNLCNALTPRLLARGLRTNGRKRKKVMATVSRRLPQRPHLDIPRREARELLNAWRAAQSRTGALAMVLVEK